MKTQLVIFLLICLCYKVSGQNNNYNFSIIKSDNYEFVKPTIDLLILFEKLSIQEWKKVIEGLNFDRKESESLPLIYLKGSLGDNVKMQSFGKDQKSVIVQWTNFTDDLLVMESIEKELTPYYVKSQGEQKWYLFEKEDIVYQFALKRNLGLGMEEIYIRKTR